MKRSILPLSKKKKKEIYWRNGSVQESVVTGFISQWGNIYPIPIFCCCCCCCCCSYGRVWMVGRGCRWGWTERLAAAAAVSATSIWKQNHKMCRGFISLLEKEVNCTWWHVFILTKWLPSLFQKWESLTPDNCLLTGITCELKESDKYSKKDSKY